MTMLSFQGNKVLMLLSEGNKLLASYHDVVATYSNVDMKGEYSQNVVI